MIFSFSQLQWIRAQHNLIHFCRESVVCACKWSLSGELWILMNKASELSSRKTAEKCLMHVKFARNLFISRLCFIMMFSFALVFCVSATNTRHESFAEFFTQTQTRWKKREKEYVAVLSWDKRDAEGVKLKIEILISLKQHTTLPRWSATFCQWDFSFLYAVCGSSALFHHHQEQWVKFD